MRYAFFIQMKIFSDQYIHNKKQMTLRFYVGTDMNIYLKVLHMQILE
jgi:hypothetical protein